MRSEAESSQTASEPHETRTRILFSRLLTVLDEDNEIRTSEALVVLAAAQEISQLGSRGMRLLDQIVTIIRGATSMSSQEKMGAISAVAGILRAELEPTCPISMGDQESPELLKRIRREFKERDARTPVAPMPPSDPSDRSEDSSTPQPQ